jgi:phage tail-like protein
MRYGMRVGAVAFCALTFLIALNGYAQEFTVNPGRFDPYKQFKFRVKWDGRYVPGIITVSGLKRTTAVSATRKGDGPSLIQKSPGPTTYEPIKLERGRTHDKSFEQWANKVWNFGSGSGHESSLKDYRKDVIVELYNEAGQLAMAFKVYRCWPSQYAAVEKLDASSADVAVESITLEYEGFERDAAVVEPVEPSFSEP